MRSLKQKLALVRPREKDPLYKALKEQKETSTTESLDEAKIRRTPKKTWTQKTTATQRRVWRRKKKLPGARAKAKLRLRKPRTRRRIKLLSQWKARRNIPKKKPGRGRRLRLSLAAGTNHVANLMEEVHGLVASIEQSNQEEMIKAYANAALVSDSLSSKFLGMAESIAEAYEEDEVTEEVADTVNDLATLSEQFESLAEEAAQSAEALHECVEEGVFSEEVNPNELQEHFQGLMTTILDGCEIYSELTEDEESEDPLGEARGRRGKADYTGGKGHRKVKHVAMGTKGKY